MNSFKFFPLVGFLALFLVSPAFAQEPTNIPEPYSPASAPSNNEDVLAPAPAPSRKVEFVKADNGRFYVALSAGSIHNGDRKFTLRSTLIDGSTDVDTGNLSLKPALTLGAKVGVRANEHVAFELESNYTRFEGKLHFSHIKILGEKFELGDGVSIWGATRHVQFINFANIVVSPVGRAFSLNTNDGTRIFEIEPTLIGGVGFVHERMSFSSGSNFLRKTGFAGNLGAGIEAKYSEMFAIGLQYRYILLNNDMALSGGPDQEGKVDNIKVGRNNAHMMTAQASLHF